jgi:hypothetical protein
MTPRSVQRIKIGVARSVSVGGPTNGVRLNTPVSSMYRRLAVPLEFETDP